MREDKTCLNCGSEVKEMYCPHCGQANTETRQPFYFLITHFIEDFVHYDSSFWHTLKNLFFRPGKITNEYLSGKRNSSVNPVKLYIFISFVTFFLIAVIPVKKSESDQEMVKNEAVQKELDAVKQNIDSLNTKGLISAGERDIIKASVELNDDVHLHDLDENSLKEFENKVDKSAPILTQFITKYRDLKSKNVSNEVIANSIVEKSLKLIPKALFVYLPFFAFLIWLFHNKKKYWYFDHGIFTLHYFSVLLISVLSIYFLNALSSYIEIGFVVTLIRFLAFLIGLYTIINLIIGLKVSYNQNWFKTIVKGFVLIFINSIIFFTVIFGIILYSYLHI